MPCRFRPRTIHAVTIATLMPVDAAATARSSPPRHSRRPVGYRRRGDSVAASPPRYRRYRAAFAYRLDRPYARRRRRRRGCGDFHRLFHAFGSRRFASGAATSLVITSRILAMAAAIVSAGPAYYCRRRQSAASLFSRGFHCDEELHSRQYYRDRSIAGSRRVLIFISSRSILVAFIWRAPRRITPATGFHRRRHAPMPLHDSSALDYSLAVGRVPPRERSATPAEPLPRIGLRAIAGRRYSVGRLFLSGYAAWCRCSASAGPLFGIMYHSGPHDCRTTVARRRGATSSRRGSMCRFVGAAGYLSAEDGRSAPACRFLSAAAPLFPFLCRRRA